ncbi:MAG: flagellar export chaperone FliS [Planctomycetes bacterium]|nr:flagellar export chaperone FliS [Planctomycetota bacterium]
MTSTSIDGDAAVTAYRHGQVLNATPLELVRLLYRRALTEVRLAETCLSAEHRGSYGAHLHRAHAIVSELQEVLDREESPEVSHNLDRLYDYVLWKFSVANVSTDVRALADARSVLETLQDAWEELARRGDVA